MRVVLVGIVLLAYSPLFSADFTLWDDWYNVVENPHLNPPTFASVWFYWQHSALDLYIPVTYSMWAIIARVAYVEQADAWGSHLNSYIFHIANVLLHAGSTLLVLEILRRLPFPVSRRAGSPFQANRAAKSISNNELTIFPPLAAIAGALLFALHPVQVETVGWVAGFKDLLAGFFSLLALSLYFNDANLEPDKKSAGESSSHRGQFYFIAATISVILAMLSKPIAMVTPAMALAIDFFLGRKIRWRVLIWFVPAIACAAIAKLSQPAPFAFTPVSIRPLIAGDALAFYLFKLLWPVRLCVDYGRTPAAALASGWAYFTPIVPVTLAILLWLKRRGWPMVITGASIFLLGLLPLLGFTPFDFQIYSTVADHYLYLPMLGVAMIAAFAVAHLPRKAALPVVIAMVLLLGMRCAIQATTWTDTFTVFNHTLEVNPRSFASHANLAAAFNRSQRPPEAETHARLALAIKPEVTSAWDSLGQALRLQNRKGEAIAAYQRSVQIDPRNAPSWTTLGHLLSDQGDAPAAIDAYRHAVQQSPMDAALRVNLASALAEDGQLEQAITIYQSALQLDPNSSQAQAGLSKASEEFKMKRNRGD